MWLAGIALLIPSLTWSQGYAETGLYFSRKNMGGSGRILGMGGVQTSLGGDYSSALSNPAGLGMYNRSEFTITPGFHSSSIKSNYLDNSATESKTNLNIPGFGLVFQTDQDGRSGFLSGTFAVSYTRSNNFNQSYSYEGLNSNNSIIDSFLEQADGFPPSQFDDNGDMANTITWLGYNNYLIGESTVLDPGNDPTIYFTDVNGVPFQRESIQTKGSQNQWSFSYGANMSDKIFLGAGVGFTNIRYSSKKTYSESFQGGPLNDLGLSEELTIRGSGINVTLGIIARPIDALQLGFSYTSPTAYNITDTYFASMTTNWNGFDYYGDGSRILNSEDAQTDEIITEYDLRTPSRISIGATYFVGKYGFLSADIDRVNYSGTRYSSNVSGISFNGENDQIKELYQPVFNYRVGGEFRYEKLRLRAGYSLMPDPFSSTQNNTKRDISSFSTGAGYRSSKFYVDFAVVFSNGSSTYRPYLVGTTQSPVVNLDTKNTLAVVTLGFPF